MTDTPESNGEVAHPLSLVESIAAELGVRQKVIEREIEKFTKQREEANVAIKALRAEGAEVKRILAAATAAKKTRATNA